MGCHVLLCAAPHNGAQWGSKMYCAVDWGVAGGELEHGVFQQVMLGTECRRRLVRGWQQASEQQRAGFDPCGGFSGSYLLRYISYYLLTDLLTF
jgi:hypothetical protein